MSLLKYYMTSLDKDNLGPYRIVRNAGVDRRWIDLAKKNMLRFFPHINRNEYEKYIKNDPYFDEMIESVRYGFIKWYNWDPRDIDVNHYFQHNINSYAYVDERFPMFIHVDQLLEAVIFWFMLLILKWSKEFGNNGDESGYFADLLYLLNEVATKGELPDEVGKSSFLNKVATDQQIQNLANDCHWAMLAFTVGHEMAHIYQMNTNRAYWETHKTEAEFNADKIGYDILLRLIMEKLNQDFVMKEYAYLAPMMYMDMFEMMYNTARILYEKEPLYGEHPSPEERKKAMFKIVEQDEYQFDAEEGNAIYYWFCLAYDRYHEKVLEYKNDGKLEHIIKKYNGRI